MTATVAAASFVATTLVRANDRHVLHRHVLHHCENVLAHAAKSENTTKVLGDTDEVERCKIVVRESALRDSRMPVDQNGRKVH